MHIWAAQTSFLLRAGPWVFFCGFSVAPEFKPLPLCGRGGAVGISRFGSSSEFIARYALQKIGLTPGKDATIVQIGSPLTRQAAMDTGKVQATVYTAIHTFTAEKKGFNILADLAALGLP